MAKHDELIAIERYMSEFVGRWYVAHEHWVKLVIWQLMIRRSFLKSQISKGGV